MMAASTALRRAELSAELLELRMVSGMLGSSERLPNPAMAVLKRSHKYDCNFGFLKVLPNSLRCTREASKKPCASKSPVHRTVPRQSRGSESEALP